MTQTAEIAQFDRSGRREVFIRQSLESLIQFKQPVIGHGRGLIGQFDASPLAAAFDSTFPPGVLDENPPHCLGSGRKQVSSVVPVLDLFGID
jgi:hypothetical protein